MLKTLGHLIWLLQGQCLLQFRVQTTTTGGKREQSPIPIVSIKDEQSPIPIVSIKDKQSPIPIVSIKDEQSPIPIVSIIIVIGNQLLGQFGTVPGILKM